MSAKREKSSPTWVDPDDAPPWTADQAARAEYAVNGEVIRPARGTLTRGPGRPRVSNPKAHVSLRLDADVLEELRKAGRGWQGKVNEILRKAVGL